MWKTNKNKPMPQEEAFKKFYEYGYQPIENYVNNLTKIACIDSEGYIVMIARGSLGKVNVYQRFSVSANPHYYIHNMNLYAKKQGISSIVLKFLESPIKNHVNILCKCECGNEFVCDANNWKRGLKNRCNSCVAHMSNIEKDVQDFLIKNNIKFINQKKFKGCKDKRALPFDFYLSDYNICIEVDGEQHFYDYSYYYDLHICRDSIEDRIKKDNIKTQFCKDNNIELIRLKYNIIRNGEFINILKDKLNIY